MEQLKLPLEEYTAESFLERMQKEGIAVCKKYGKDVAQKLSERLFLGRKEWECAKYMTCSDTLLKGADYFKKHFNTVLIKIEEESQLSYTDLDMLKISERYKKRLIQNGYVCLDDFKDKFHEDLAAIEGLGPKGLHEIKSCLKFDHKITIKKKPKVTTPKSLVNLIVESYIKPSLHNSYDPSIKKNCWSHNAKIASQLGRAKPEEGFWKSFDIGFKLNTLTYFFKPDGKKKLEAAYTIFKNQGNHKDIVKKKEEVILGKDKIGDDIERKSTTSGKPKSIRDFLSS